MPMLPQQDTVANLQALRDEVEKTPSYNLNLNYWNKPHSCGTMYCLAGLAAATPYFQLRGMNSNNIGMPIMYRLHIDDDLRNTRETVRYFFGRMGGINGNISDPMDYLFAWRGASPWDEQLLAIKSDMSDKELAIARIDRAIELQKLNTAAADYARRYPESVWGKR